ncbi:unnamed protein product [Discula destructiva]
MKRPDPVWPRKIVRDIAYLFIPFAFAIFLLLLGVALLTTRGKLSNSALVGFCVTAGMLIGFFSICHLALYCTWAKENTKKTKNDRSSSDNGSLVIARPVKVESPRVCRKCMGGIPSSRLPAAATFGPPMRNNAEVQAGVEEGSHQEEAIIRPQAEQNQPQREGQIRNDPEDRVLQSMSHASAEVAPLQISNTPRARHRDERIRGLHTVGTPASPDLHSVAARPSLLPPLAFAQVSGPDRVTTPTSPANLNRLLTSTTSLRQARNSRSPSIGQHPTSPTTLQYAPPDPRPDDHRQPLPPRTPSLPSLSPAKHAKASQPGSPLRQTQHAPPFSPQHIGLSPASQRRPVGPRPHPPHETEQLAALAITGDSSYRAARESVSQRAISAEYTNLQQQQQQATKPTKSYKPYRSPAFRAEETHMMLFRESDLLDLIARGVIRVKPESHPPAWMLLTRFATRRSHSSPKSPCGVENHCETKAEKDTAELSQPPPTVDPHKDVKTHLTLQALPKPPGSVDSGYGSESSGPLSAATVMGPGEAEWLDGSRFARSALPAVRSTGSAVSFEEERRVLRRRDSVPELRARFWGLWGDELLDTDADDEGRAVSSTQYYVLDEMGSLGIMLRRLSEDGRYMSGGGGNSQDG